MGKIPKINEVLLVMEKSPVISKARAFILTTRVHGFMIYPGLARALKARVPSLGLTAQLLERLEQ